MDIRRVGLEDAEQAEGVVVVIDVIRAFTVSAYAFGGGAVRLWLVRYVEDAFTLRERRPETLLAGEVHGRLIEGFDHNNSPSRMARADVRDRTVIQVTGAGTQGALRAVRADVLLPCALVNARATATLAKALAEQQDLPITLLPTYRGNGLDRLEDDICADYLESLLGGMADSAAVLEDSMEALAASGRFEMFAGDDADFPAGDIAAFSAVDCFAFAMRGERHRWRDIDYVEVRREDMPPP